MFDALCLASMVCAAFEQPCKTQLNGDTSTVHWNVGYSSFYKLL